MVRRLSLLSMSMASGGRTNAFRVRVSRKTTDDIGEQSQDSSSAVSAYLYA